MLAGLSLGAGAQERVSDCDSDELAGGREASAPCIQLVRRASPLSPRSGGILLMRGGEISHVAPGDATRVPALEPSDGPRIIAGKTQILYLPPTKPAPDTPDITAN